MLNKEIGMLRSRSVAGVRIHDQLRVGQVLREQESVDRNDNNVFITMRNESGARNLPQHRVTVTRRYYAPLPNRVGRR